MKIKKKMVSEIDKPLYPLCIRNRESEILRENGWSEWGSEGESEKAKQKLFGGLGSKLLPAYAPAVSVLYVYPHVQLLKWALLFWAFRNQEVLGAGYQFHWEKHNQAQLLEFCPLRNNSMHATQPAYSKKIKKKYLLVFFFFFPFLFGQITNGFSI